MGPKSNHKCPLKEEEDDLTGRRGGAEKKVEAEPGVTVARAEQCQQPPEAGRGRGGSLLQPSKGAQPF